MTYTCKDENAKYDYQHYECKSINDVVRGTVEFNDKNYICRDGSFVDESSPSAPALGSNPEFTPPANSKCGDRYTYHKGKEDERDFLCAGVFGCVDEKSTDDWLSPAVSDENIKNINGCDIADRYLIPDGKYWRECDGSRSWIAKFPTRDFLCLGKGEPYILNNPEDTSFNYKPATVIYPNTIIECKGISEQSYIINSKEWYCNPGNRWVDNLDEAGESICNSNGGKWTGSQCCEKGDYYRDSAGKQACLDGNVLGNSQIISDSVSDSISVPKKSLLNVEGTLYACNIDTANPILNKVSYLDSRNYAGSSLCTTIPQRKPLQDDDFICASNGWFNLKKYANSTHEAEFTLNSQDFHLTSNPSADNSGCCIKDDECWDGAKCRKNQESDYSSPSYFPGSDKRCINGAWQDSPPKASPDGKTTGFCPGNQCYKGAAAANPCVNNGDTQKNYYCDNGNWLSRTRYVATQLLSIAGNDDDYVMLCDKKEAVFNQVPKDLLTNLNIDERSFCVIKIKTNAGASTKTIVGISVDENVKSLPLGTVFGSIENCNLISIPTEDKYKKCTDNLLFNPLYNILLYSEDGLSSYAGQSQENSNAEFGRLSRRIESINSATPSFDLTDYDKIFSFKNKGLKITSAFEYKSMQNVIYLYEEIGFDVCKIINDNKGKYEENYNPSVTCGTDYMHSSSEYPATNNLLLIWLDLTSKLMRIS